MTGTFSGNSLWVAKFQECYCDCHRSKKLLAEFQAFYFDWLGFMKLALNGKKGQGRLLWLWHCSIRNYHEWHCWLLFHEELSWLKQFQEYFFYYLSPKNSITTSTLPWKISWLAQCQEFYYSWLYSLSSWTCMKYLPREILKTATSSHSSFVGYLLYSFHKLSISRRPTISYIDWILRTTKW